MRHLTFRERESISIGQTEGISEVEAESIKKLEARLPAGFLEWGHHTLKLRQFCGVFRTPLLTVEILPKINHDDHSHEEARGLLVKMLAQAGELNLRRMGDAGLGQQRHHLLDVFIEDFCSRVKAAIGGGAIALYSERRENLGAIRGRLELTEHLRVNAFDRSRLFCRFDEWSIDNPYNRALKAVLRILLGRTVHQRPRTTVAALLHRLDDVGEQKTTARDVAALRMDRTISHWEPVFAQARRLLEGLNPDVRKGDVAGTALLFDMERLFETVLRNRIRNACRTRLRDDPLSVGTLGKSVSLATSGFQLRPDIIVKQGDEILAILDAKWKQLNTTDSRPGVSSSGVLSSDAYQMNAYASRFGCNRLALVYPAWSDCPAGTVREFVFETNQRPSERPTLAVIAVDLRELAIGTGIPAGLDALVHSG